MSKFRYVWNQCEMCCSDNISLMSYSQLKNELCYDNAHYDKLMEFFKNNTSYDLDQFYYQFEEKAKGTTEDDYDRILDDMIEAIKDYDTDSKVIARKRYTLEKEIARLEQKLATAKELLLDLDNR